MYANLAKKKKPDGNGNDLVIICNCIIINYNIICMYDINIEQTVSHFAQV